MSPFRRKMYSLAIVGLQIAILKKSTRVKILVKTPNFFPTSFSNFLPVLGFFPDSTHLLIFFPSRRMKIYMFYLAKINLVEQKVDYSLFTLIITISFLTLRPFSKKENIRHSREKLPHFSPSHILQYRIKNRWPLSKMLGCQLYYHYSSN